MGVSSSVYPSNFNAKPLTLPRLDFSFDEIITRKNIKDIISAIPFRFSVLEIEIHSKCESKMSFQKRYSYYNNLQDAHCIYLRCKDNWHLSLEFTYSQKKKIPCVLFKIDKIKHNVTHEGWQLLLKKDVRCDLMDVLSFGVEKFLKEESENSGNYNKNSQHFANFIYFNSFK